MQMHSPVLLVQQQIGIYRTLYSATVGGGAHDAPVALFRKTTLPTAVIGLFFFGNIPFSAGRRGRRPLQCVSKQNDKLKFDILRYAI